MSKAPESASGVRLDKWLWAARFFKTRSLSSEEIGRGRITINGQLAKASRDVRVGDLIDIRHAGGQHRTFEVKALSAVRGPAPVAQTLYEETLESRARQEVHARLRKEAPEPAHSIEQGRPTKRNRRDLADWNRWSASLDAD